jgi:hypothetical protein
LHLPSQRQAGFTGAPYAPSIPAPASPPSFQLKQEPNPNIDPSLKNAGLPVGGSTAGFVDNMYGFAPQGLGVNSNGMVATVGDDRFRMGVPQGLLEGFPLGFDIGQGTGQIPS